MEIKKKPIPWGAKTLKTPSKQKRVLSIPRVLPPSSSLSDRFDFFCPVNDDDPLIENDHHRLCFSILTEKPLYQGGERVEISCFVYDKWSKKPLKPNEQKINPEKVKIAITDEHGIVIQYLKIQLDRGVGVITSSFILKRNFEGGLYKVEIRYYEAVVDRAKFYVMKLNEKRNSIALDLNKDQIEVGEELVGKLTLKMFTRMEDFFRTGGLGEKISFKVSIMDQDFNEIDNLTKNLSHGKGFFNYTIPDSANDFSSIFIIIEMEFDRETLEISREVIINKLKNMHVKFVAGGGKYVTDCENQIYYGSFSSRDMIDTMKFKNGKIIEKTESEEKEVISEISSNDDGRGEISLQIKKNCEYYLQIQEKETVRVFPIITSENITNYPNKKFSNVQMRIKSRVYSEKESINIFIKNNPDSNIDRFRLVLVDKLRVLHEAIVSFPNGYSKGNMRIDLRSVSSLLNGGVINVQLYDYANTVHPLQESLIFIEPKGKLKMGISFDKPKYSPGDTVNFEVNLGDRNGVVGVVVSDETPFLELERRDLPTSLCTKVFLEKELFFPSGNFEDSSKYIDWLFENNEFLSQQLLEAGGISPNYGLIGYKENKKEQLSILLGMQDWRLFFLNENSVRTFARETSWDCMEDPLNHLLGLSTKQISGILYPDPKYLQMVCNDHGVRHGVFCQKRNSYE